MADGDMRSRKLNAAVDGNAGGTPGIFPAEPDMSAPEMFLFLENTAEQAAAIGGIDTFAGEVSFSDKLSAYLKERSMTAAELGEAALLSRSFTYQLCSGVRSPGRDIVLRVALVLGLPLEETQYLLRAADRGALCPRVRRDAIIIWCIGKHRGLFDTDEVLTSNGEKTLL